MQDYSESFATDMSYIDALGNLVKHGMPVEMVIGTESYNAIRGNEYFLMFYSDIIRKNNVNIYIDPENPDTDRLLLENSSENRNSLIPVKDFLTGISELNRL